MYLISFLQSSERVLLKIDPNKYIVQIYISLLLSCAIVVIVTYTLCFPIRTKQNVCCAKGPRLKLAASPTRNNATRAP